MSGITVAMTDSEAWVVRQALTAYRSSQNANARLFGEGAEVDGDTNLTRARDESLAEAAACEAVWERIVDAQQASVAAFYAEAER